MIWNVKPVVEVINYFNRGTLVETLGIEITEFGEDFVKASMPVDHRTKQPMGLLHGGASVALSESIGSMASWLVIGDPNKSIVSIEVNANHLKAARDGVGIALHDRLDWAKLCMFGILKYLMKKII